MGRVADLVIPEAAVTVDLVVLTIRDDDLVVLCVRRGIPPYAGKLALPGGFVQPDETLAMAAARELAEETGLTASTSPAARPVQTTDTSAAAGDGAAAEGSAAAGDGAAAEDGAAAGDRAAVRAGDGAAARAVAGSGGVHLEQLASYGDPGRDPRMRVVTIAYLALAPSLPTPRAGSDAADACWMAAGMLLAGPADGLAFDHYAILADGVERARAKLEYSPLATAFCPATFTVGQLRRVYEIVWATRLDPRNFHRKVTGTPGFLVPAGGTTVGERGRPAQLYRRGDADLLHPPLLRSPAVEAGDSTPSAGPAMG